MFQIKIVEKIKTHVLFWIHFSENCAVYEIMWGIVVQPGRPQSIQYVTCALHAR